MKYFLIMNPASRGGRSKRKFQRIWDLLDKKEIKYDYKIAQSPWQIRQISRNARAQYYDIIVAVGGDGTINAVLNGFFDAKEQKPSEAKMGVIYAGTSPDFCKSYHIPISLEEAIKTLITQRTRNIRVMKASFMPENLASLNNQGLEKAVSPVVGYFACCANIGMGASIARSANSGIRTYLGDTLGTFLSLIRTIANYQANAYTIVKDGQSKTLSNLYNISIGRTRHIASGIVLDAHFDEMDDRLYYLTLSNLNWRKVPRLVKNIYSGKPFKNDEMLTLDYCRTFEVYGNATNPELEYDGDPMGYLPCRIELAPERLPLIVG